MKNGASSWFARDLPLFHPSHLMQSEDALVYTNIAKSLLAVNKK